MTEQDSAPSTAGVAEQVTISTVEQLKALADPTRLAILEALMSAGPGRREPSPSLPPPLPVMSVKELAEALHEPQTKLYRHVKVLESAGLIKVAATRLVSGIAEQRYQACQRDFDLAGGVLHQHVDETEAVLRAVFDLFRSGYIAAWRTHPPPGTTMFGTGTGRRSPAEVAAVRASLAEALAHFDGDDSDDPDAVHMSVLAGYFLEPEGEPG